MPKEKLEWDLPDYMYYRDPNLPVRLTADPVDSVEKLENN